MKKLDYMCRPAYGPARNSLGAVMKVFMFGEAANHADKLAAGLGQGWQIVPLPHEAAHSAGFDDAIGPEDVVISLRYRRPAGQARRFRLLHVPGAGTDGIDFDSLVPGTVVCNVFEHEIPIAEYILLAMLDWEIRPGDMRSSFSPEIWSDVYRNRRPHGEIHGMTLGILGFGRIGGAVGARARAFGMRVMAVDPSPAGDEGSVEVLAPSRLGDMLRAADFLVICCPLTPATRQVIDAEALRAMKPRAVLINVSRAEIVDEAALYEALSMRRIGGAWLDVWYGYPAGSDDRAEPCSYPFHKLPNAVCTPHSSAWTERLPFRRYARIAENLERLRRGEPLANVVRSPAPAPAAERQ